MFNFYRGLELIEWFLVCLYNYCRQSEVRDALLSLKQVLAVAFNVSESLQCAETNLASSLPPLTDYEDICSLVEEHCVCILIRLFVCLSVCLSGEFS